jgi:hypothetical protein
MENLTCDKPYTSTDKWTASIISGLTFLIVSSPYTYSLTDSLVHTTTAAAGKALPSNGASSTLKKGVNTTDASGRPNIPGLMIHSVAYMLIIRIMMEKRNLAGCKKPYNSKDKWIASSIGGLMFLVTSSPFLYDTINGLTSKFGLDTLDEDGCPNMQGLLLHTALFTVATRILMY